MGSTSCQIVIIGLLSIINGHSFIFTITNSILIAGKSGVGRRNAVTIASYMLGYEYYSPAIPRDYSMKSFLMDMKGVLLTAGIKGEHIVLLIEDYQITNEGILEVINSLLSSGEVPGRE